MFSRMAVRTRVLVFMVLLTVFTLALSGTVAYALQRAELHRSMDSSLGRMVTEFVYMGEEGADPSTGQPWQRADDLIYSFMLRNLLDEDESMIAVREGEVVWTANESQEVRLEEDPEFVAWVTEELPITEHRLRTAETSQSTYRAVIVPVQMPEDAEATHFVLAFDVDAGMSSLNRSFLIYASTGAGAVVVAGLLGWALVGRLLLPMRLLRETAQSITETDISRRIPVEQHRRRDDLAELTVTVNEMLDRLETAVTSQRQLLDDVGHELRTPLTIVRGHLELLEEEDPQDVRAVRALSLDELDRMSMLIEDLVTLAKSDQEDFLKPRPVDVDTLTEQVFEKAARLGERDWRLEARARTVAPLDSHRITQAWLQLAANAVKFSPEGSQISLGSSLGGEQEGSRSLYLWVKDAGQGISDEDRERIFSRFYRGASARGTEGSGLGLTIVESIARLHGGSVRVESVPGAGSIFTMVLPMTQLHRLPMHTPAADGGETR